jgi:hypothetical protein
MNGTLHPAFIIKSISIKRINLMQVKRKLTLNMIPHPNFSHKLVPLLDKVLN